MAPWLVLLGQTAMMLYFVHQMIELTLVNELLGIRMTSWPVYWISNAVFVVVLVSRETARTKLVLVAMGLILAAPLLWAPVLGVAAGAALAGSTIEYSSVYAGFRIAFGRLSYTVTETILGSPVVEAAWTFMQGLAAFVGFLAALGQVWRMLKSMAGPSEA